MNPENLLYSKQHEWLKVEGDIGVVGITDYAQKELGDVVFIDFPQVGSRVVPGNSLGTIESVKAVSEIFSPASGEIVEVNADLAKSPETVNTDPYGKGWLVRIRLDKGAGDGLMSAADYTQYTAG